LNRLYRSQKNRVIGGVAGGLAEYFDVDVVLVRVLWVLAIFVGGGGLIAYIIAWIIVPEEKKVTVKSREINKAKTAPEGDIPETAEDGPEAAKSVPEAADTEEETEKEQQARARRRRNAGLVLIGLGVIFLVRQVFGFLFHYLWPLLFIALGAFFLLRNGKEDGR